MKKIDIDLWVEYHNNKKRIYTKKEMSEIRACEFAMHLLVPTKNLLTMVDIEEFKNDSITGQMLTIQKLAETFNVPYVVVSIKLEELVNKMLILPKEKILDMIDIDDFKNDSITGQMLTTKHLAEHFGVSYTTMSNRLEEISNNINKSKNKKKSGIKRLLKK